MAKFQYYFNSESLKYDKVRKNNLKQFVKISVYTLLSISVAIGMNWTYRQFDETPKIKQLARENNELLGQYDLLSKKVEAAHIALSRIEHRDDYFYRTIFQADPIPSTMREAGFGGSNKYEYLENLQNADKVIDVTRLLDQLTKKVYVQSKSYDEVSDLALNKEQMIRSIPSIQPLSIKNLSRISDYYGMRVHPIKRRRIMHDGIDLVGPVGSEIYSTGDGVVSYVEDSRFGYGKQVVIDHGFGYKTRYGHLNKILVKKGQEIKRGDIIGTLGRSGGTTGPHLHYEVILKNRPVNPLNYYFKDLDEEAYEEMIKKLTASTDDFSNANN